MASVKSVDEILHVTQHDYKQQEKKTMTIKRLLFVGACAQAGWLGMSAVLAHAIIN